MTARILTLYHRKGCHLCDEMHRKLTEDLAGRDIVIELVNIDKDPELCARYGSDIPVLMVGDREICRHRLKPGQIERFLTN